MSLLATPFLVPINGNMEIVPTKLIEELKSEVSGQVIDRARVIDHLLDLRLQAGDDERFVAAVDDVLGSVPGQNSVETSWWTSTLDVFASLADRLPA